MASSSVIGICISKMRRKRKAGTAVINARIGMEMITMVSTKDAVDEAVATHVEAAEEDRTIKEAATMAADTVSSMDTRGTATIGKGASLIRTAAISTLTRREVLQ